jgi:hypothetical protein
VSPRAAPIATKRSNRRRLRSVAAAPAVAACASSVSIERLIGSIRRECLDYVIISNETHLRRVLSSHFQYYHKSRTHIALNKDCPLTRSISSSAFGKILTAAQLVGLHHGYERRAA